MKISRRVLYTGRVQGVGFRYSVKQIAMGYDVIGWVRNLPDGSVEMQTAGDPAEVEAFLSAVAASHLAGYIRNISQQDADEPDPLSSGFEIRQ